MMSRNETIKELKRWGLYKLSKWDKFKLWLFKHRWEILFLTFMLACLGWTLAEIIIGFALGLY